MGKFGTQEIPEGWCFVHNRIEHPRAKKLYRWCFECGHSYRTRLELWWRYLHGYRGSSSLLGRKHWLPVLTRRPSQIPFCPECLHDW